MTKHIVVRKTITDDLEGSGRITRVVDEVEVDPTHERIRVLHPTGGPMMTKQEMALDTDVNIIMNKWLHAGVPPAHTGREARYGDFSGEMSYQQSLNAVLEAQQMFDELPALVRKACDNDPGKFLEMCADESRIEELKKLGLVEERLPPFVRVLREEAAAEGAAAEGPPAAGTVG